MGRANPMHYQMTPCIYEPTAVFVPVSIADGRGNSMIFVQATSEQMIERMLRSALSEMGSYVALAHAPFSGKQIKDYAVERTVSLAWRIGRAVALCRQQNRVEQVADVIIDEIGGRESGRVLFKGKIVEVARRLVKGHSYGEVVIEAMDVSGKGVSEFAGKMKIPFKNENLLATVEEEVCFSLLQTRTLKQLRRWSRPSLT
jgi:DUF917 family protein